MDRSGDIRRGDPLGRKDIRKSLEHSRGPHSYQSNRFLARLYSARASRIALTVTIYDVPAGREVQTLRYLDSLGPGGLIVAVKYSPQGERIAAATENAVHVWDSNDGRLLISIKMQVSPWRRNRANDLLWFNNNIFVMSTDHKIKQIDASTGAVVSEWPITKDCSHIAMPHQTLIAYVAHDNDNVMFWDTSAHTHRHLIQTPKFIQSTAFSSDGQLLAIAAQLSGKITIKPLLSYIFVGFMYSSISAELN